MQVRRLKIERFRGVEDLIWHPKPGLNCLTGPGDVGKSTVLDAIALMLSPAPVRVASEHDYLNGEIEKGFVIDLVLGELSEDVLSAWPVAPLCTWIEGKKKLQSEPDQSGEPVLCLRVKGTEDLEVEHLVVDPSEGESRLSPSKRQLFGLTTMSAAATGFREFRMSRGSLLSRNIEPSQLRGLITEAVQISRDQFSTPAEIEKQLEELTEALAVLAPEVGDLKLGLLSPRGQNLLSMIGLFTDSPKSEIPLANAGLGTQQLALFTLARILIGDSPLFVVDEIETGLEPFRQRDLIARIREAIKPHGQAFITTHSPAAVGEMVISELYRLDAAESHPVEVSRYPDELNKIVESEPEALLSRLPVLVEGSTELGLLECLLGAEAVRRGTSLGALGICLVDGGGQPKLFKPASALRKMKLKFGVFIDTENHHAGSRKELSNASGVSFGTYTGARCLEEALADQLSLESLDQLIAAPLLDGRVVADARYQQLNAATEKPSRRTLVELSSMRDEASCKELFSRTADKGSWFKTRENGRMVGQFLLDNHPDIKIVQDVAEFWSKTVALLPNPPFSG